MTEITDHAKQMAADLANAEFRVIPKAYVWKADDFTGGIGLALARLCARTIERDARLARMEADMAEIDRLAIGYDWSTAQGDSTRQAAAIAARYRVEAGALLIEARKMVAARSVNAVPDYIAEVLAGKYDAGADVQWAHEALKRGLELGRAK